MSYNNIRKGSASFGGARPISTGRRWILKHSGFALNLDDVPSITDGLFLPAGIPLVCDEATHIARPLKMAKVKSVNTKVIKIAPTTEFSLYPFTKGKTVIKLGATLSTSSSDKATIASVTSTGTETTITLSAAIAGLAAGDYIMVANSDGTTFGEPNAILATSVYKDADATAVFANAAIKLTDGEIYARRIPEMHDLVKEALRKAGCEFTFTQSY